MTAIHGLVGYSVFTAFDTLKWNRAMFWVGEVPSVGQPNALVFGLLSALPLVLIFHLIECKLRLVNAPFQNSPAHSGVLSNYKQFHREYALLM